MLNFLLEFPNISPIAIDLGVVAIRWYSLAYIAGLVFGWLCIKRMNMAVGALSAKQHDDILTWAVLGVILGGRLGYVLFYKPLEYLQNPLEIVQIWQGGMSFHGGMIGMVLAIFAFTKRNKIAFFPVMDMIAVAAPIGLFFGRIANFVNGELWGRATNSWVGMVFPTDPLQITRHPSQLYQAGLEGLLLGLVLLILFRSKFWQKPAFLSGAFLIFYAIFRIFGEFFREPDAHLGFLFAGATMGQMLSLPMFALGIYLTLTAKIDKKWHKKNK